MGNTSDHQLACSFDNIKKDFDQVRQDTKGMVLLNKHNQNTYLLKEYTYGTDAMYRHKEKTLREQIQQGMKEYIVSPVKVQSKVFSSFCSTSYKVYAIFEYPQVTLREEIMARQKENKSFEEAELWSILQSCTNALSELKPMLSLNPLEIFINPDGHIKIIHDDLIDENYRIMLNEQIYYAPEKMKNFNKLDSELTLRKQSIFSMGMTILEAAQLSDVSSCYNFRDCYFSETIMVDMLDFLSEKYSQEFVEILGNILEPNPNRRASLMEVQKVLDNFWNSEQEASMEHHYDESKGVTQLAQNDGESVMQQFPLAQKSMNQQNIANGKDSGRKSIAKEQKHMKVASRPSLYTFQQPVAVAPEEFAPITPKNPITTSENCLYTDPKLLDMIRQDLQDINKLKHSAFYETSKYTFMYPQTQSILNSIKNFDTESKQNQGPIAEFSNIKPVNFQETEPQTISQQNNYVMMKKNHSELIYTVESFEDGRRYEGTTLNGKKHGKGKLIFEDGAYYEGNFSQDKMNGHGTLFYRQNFPAYNGSWYNDQFHGVGVLFNENPQNLDCEYDYREMSEVEQFWTRYEGQFCLDNKHGRGRLTLTNGQTYDGQFQDDSISGHGVYTCMSGQIIQGQWDINNLVRVIRQQ